DFVGILPEFLESGEHRRARVHQKRRRATAHEIRALAPTAAAECITCTKHHQLYAVFQRSIPEGSYGVSLLADAGKARPLSSTLRHLAQGMSAPHYVVSVCSCKPCPAGGHCCAS